MDIFWGGPRVGKWDTTKFKSEEQKTNEFNKAALQVCNFPLCSGYNHLSLTEGHTPVGYRGQYYVDYYPYIPNTLLENKSWL